MSSYHLQSQNEPFQAPSIINPPLQIFGGSDQDTSPTIPDFPGPFFGDEQTGGFEERDEAKRRRIARV